MGHFGFKVALEGGGAIFGHARHIAAFQALRSLVAFGDRAVEGHTAHHRVLIGGGLLRSPLLSRTLTGPTLLDAALPKQHVCAVQTYGQALHAFGSPLLLVD